MSQKVANLEPTWGHLGPQNRLGTVQEGKRDFKNEAKKEASKKCQKVAQYKPVLAMNGKRAEIQKVS